MDRRPGQSDEALLLAVEDFVFAKAGHLSKKVFVLRTRSILLSATATKLVNNLFGGAYKRRDTIDCADIGHLFTRTFFPAPQAFLVRFATFLGRHFAAFMPRLGKFVFMQTVSKRTPHRNAFPVGSQYDDFRFALGVHCGNARSEAVDMLGHAAVHHLSCSDGSLHAEQIRT